MKLNKLILSNFRGFDQLEIEFDPRLTVIAGVNGSGKSSILKSLIIISSMIENYALSTSAPEIKLKNSDVKIGGESSFILVEGHAHDESLSLQTGRALVDKSEFPQIKKKITKLREDLRYLKEDPYEADNKENEIAYLKKRLQGYDDTESFHAPGLLFTEDPAPVFIYFSTQRAFVDLPKKFTTPKPLSPEAAHDGALESGRVSLNAFANWFRVALNNELGPSPLSSSLWKSLEDTMALILPEFTQLILEAPEGKLPFFSILKGETRFHLSQLSDGEKALLALTMDILQRLSLANPTSESPATEGKGVIFIDEIELHLHPTWQRQVLSRLTKAFPSCQFIVTTHSPQVLGEVKAERIRILEYDDETQKIEIYTPDASLGLDSNRILDELMGTAERNKETTEKLNTLFRLIDAEDFDAAREAIKALPKLHDDPEITRANTLIKFLENSDS